MSKAFEANHSKITILYARLSRDDGEDGTSNSIKNQHDFLTDYAERNGFTPYKFVQDDGYSGTSFNRPGWSDIMADIEAGRVSNLIAKDASRLGRDYLRMGLYREMFREKGVRLIAVNDNIDTSVADDDFTPFREIINEWFAKDCSKKIRAVFKNRMANGKRCSGAIPYGYLRHNGDVNDIIVDNDASVIVRRMFAMIIDGKGVNAIAQTLMDEQIPIPSEHLKRHGEPSRHTNYTDPFAWTPNTVRTIIANPAYKGTLVLGKTRNASYKGKKAVPTTEDERYIFENALPVIVDPETWETAQRLKRTVRRSPKCDEAPNPLTGLLFCAQCGAKMSHRRSKNKDGYRENAYVCSHNRKGIVKACSLHYISSRNVSRLILAAIRRVSAYALADEVGFVQKIREASVLQQENAVKEQKKLLSKSQRRVAELDVLITRLYEDRARDKIPEKHYERLRRCKPKSPIIMPTASAPIRFWSWRGGTPRLTS